MSQSGFTVGHPGSASQTLGAQKFLKIQFTDTPASEAILLLLCRGL